MVENTVATYEILGDISISVSRTSNFGGTVSCCPPKSPSLHSPMHSIAIIHPLVFTISIIAN